MLAPHNSKSLEMHSARAFRQRVLRQALAMGLSFGLSSLSIASIANAQSSPGDVPASPWSKRSETTPAIESAGANRSPSKRLRQPSKTSADSPAAPIQLTEPQPIREYRPAPVTLMGPMAPTNSVAPSEQMVVPSESRAKPQRTSSASFGKLQESSQLQAQDDEPSVGRTESRFDNSPAAPSQALTQKTPVVAQSDRQRLPAGGIALDSDRSIASPASPPSSNLFRDSSREQSVTRNPSRIGIGLPDRVGLPDRTEEDLSSSLPSQMASVKSTIGPNESIQLKATSRAKPLANLAEEETRLSPSVSTRSNMGTKALGNQPVVEEQPGLVQLSDRGPLAFPSTEERVERNVGQHFRQTVEANSDSMLRSAPERLDELQMKRIALADRVSHELLSNAPVDAAGVPQALESLPGWQAIEQELRQRLDRCDTLLKRGAVMSAREEAFQGLLRLYRTMDLHRGKMYSEAALEKAIVALREGMDFQRALGSSSHSSVQSIVNTHTTDALKNRPLDTTSTEMAAMHYRWYARYQLVTASDGHPWAADLLYAYGKTIEKEADLNPSKASLYRNQAVIFYQAATQVKPTHTEAASQLGFALIHLDRLEDAYTVLSASVRQSPSANAWNNLAEVYRRRGANAEAEYAVQQANSLTQNKTQYSPENPEIVEVDPSTFAKYSPIPTMASPSQNGVVGNQQAVPTDAGAGVRSAKSGNRFLSKIFQ